MYLVIALVLIIPTLIGMVRAWYRLVYWGDKRIRPVLGDRQGFILTAVILPILFFATVTLVTVLLGRYYGAYFFIGILVSFALYGLFWLYMRYIWR